MDNKVENRANEGTSFQQQPACDPDLQTCYQTEIQRCKDTVGGTVLRETTDIHPLAPKENGDSSTSTSKLPKGREK